MRHKLIPFRSSGRQVRGTGKAQRAGFSMAKDSSKEIGIASFFFRNFPDGCFPSTLRKKFGEVGDVFDIFCAKKKDRTGNNFGFVRFSKSIISDYKTFSDKMNNLWIGSYKIRVFPAKFERAGKNSQISQPNNVYQFPADCGRYHRGMSFKEVLTEAGSANDEKPKNDDSEEHNTFLFSTVKEDKEWLRNCWIGRLKDGLIWEDIGDELQEEWEGKTNVMTWFSSKSKATLNHRQKSWKNGRLSGSKSLGCGKKRMFELIDQYGRFGTAFLFKRGVSISSKKHVQELGN